MFRVLFQPKVYKFNNFEMNMGRLNVIKTYFLGNSKQIDDMNVDDNQFYGWVGCAYHFYIGFPSLAFLSLGVLSQNPLMALPGVAYISDTIPRVLGYDRCGEDQEIFAYQRAPGIIGTIRDKLENKEEPTLEDVVAQN